MALGGSCCAATVESGGRGAELALVLDTAFGDGWTWLSEQLVTTIREATEISVAARSLMVHSLAARPSLFRQRR
jgi:hypothetical protein